MNDADEESDDEYIGEDVWSEEVCSDDACSEDDDSEDDIDEGGRKAILDRESVDFLAGEFCALLQRQRKRAEALEAAAGDGHDLLKAVVATQRASAQDEPLVENDEVWGQVEPMQQLLNALVRKPFAPLDMCGKLGAMR